LFFVEGLLRQKQKLLDIIYMGIFTYYKGFWIKKRGISMFARRVLTIVLSALLVIGFSNSSFARGGHGSSHSSHSSGDVHVNGYYNSHGTYVAPHMRSHPDGNFYNNWSTKGNVNPYTGEWGTKTHPSDSNVYSGSSYSGSSYSGSRYYIPTINQHEEPGGVRVTLPTFDVTVNGTKINNDTSKYPVIVYKDITYFPMTWNYTQALGLDTAWSANTGFSIHKGKATTTSLQQESGFNTTTMTAQLPDYNIFVNDSWVDNSKEEYPILTYKDITYFPMTWQNASEQLGVNVDFNQDTGLSISNGN
jgi:hypothetical protein